MSKFAKYQSSRRKAAQSRWMKAVEMRKRGSEYWRIAEALNVSVPRAFALVLKGEELK